MEHPDLEYIAEFDRIAGDSLFKILSEPARISLIRHLAVNGPSDISTIASAFPQDRSVISRHLKMMADYGLLTVEKRARSTVYSFDGYAFLNRLEGLASMVRGFLNAHCELSPKE